MNSGDWNVIAGHAAGSARIITRGDDAFVFVRRANEQSREFDVGSAFQRRGSFGVKIEIRRCDRHFDVSASQRWRDRGVKKRLSKRAAGEAKYFGRIFTCAVSALDSGRQVQF